MTELNVDGWRNLIGTAGNDLSDEQVLDLRNSLVALAGVIVDACAAQSFRTGNSESSTLC
jgi:hypothetical protein